MKTDVLKISLAAIVTMFVIWSCASDPNIESAKLALVEENYEQVIRSAERALETNPENADGYYYIGVAYAAMAGNKPVAERLDDYQSARDNFDEAKRRYDTQSGRSSEARELPEKIIEYWGNEYNSGVGLLTEDIVSTSEDSLAIARQHFLNAIAINPDSAQSYNLLVEVSFALGNFEDAEEYTRHIIYELEDADLFNYYRLSYFLLQNDREDDALQVLLEARELYPDEIEIVQEIANLYLRRGETDLAMELVQELIERDPDNPQYRLVFATQVYQMVQELDRQIRSIYDDMYDKSREIRQERQKPNPDEAVLTGLRDELSSLEDEADMLIEESFRFSEEAEEELLLALENDQENEEVHSTLGIIYQNRAAILQDQRNMADDLEDEDRFDEQARAYLRQAIPHFEKATELNEDNVENWRSLFRVYTHLGMEEEAERAQEKAGL
ncbi:MAG: tetratricopeptide repeat protein [Balneolales bacterium]